VLFSLSSKEKQRKFTKAPFLPILTSRSDTNGFDEFAEISSSLGTVVRNTLNGVTQTVEQIINTEDPSAEGGVFEFFSSGAFAEAVVDSSELNATVQNGAIAALAAPVINKLWNEQRAVVMRVDRGLLSGEDEADPCEGDNIFPRRDKFCFGNDMYVVQRYPRLGEGDIQFGRRDYFALPGADQLEQFGLTLGQIAEAAVINQEANGMFGLSQTDRLIETIRDGSRDLNLADGIIFNFPVCSISSVSLDDFQCRIRFADTNVSRRSAPRRPNTDETAASSMQTPAHDGLCMPTCHNWWRSVAVRAEPISMSFAGQLRISI
jgi:hypothetical protein